jgi:hypothetical protein
MQGRREPGGSINRRSTAKNGDESDWRFPSFVPCVMRGTVCGKAAAEVQSDTDSTLLKEGSKINQAPQLREEINLFRAAIERTERNIRIGLHTQQQEKIHSKKTRYKITNSNRLGR